MRSCISRSKRDLQRSFELLIVSYKMYIHALLLHKPSTIFIFNPYIRKASIKNRILNILWSEGCKTRITNEWYNYALAAR